MQLWVAGTLSTATWADLLVKICMNGSRSGISCLLVLKVVVEFPYAIDSGEARQVVRSSADR